MLNIIKRIFYLFLITLSLIFIFFSLHSHFILRKTDFYFMLTALLFSMTALIISLLLFLNKIKLININSNGGPNLNIFMGVLCIIISISFIFSLNSPLLSGHRLQDMVGIFFFGIGGLILFHKGLKQRKS